MDVPTCIDEGISLPMKSDTGRYPNNDIIRPEIITAALPIDVVYSFDEYCRRYDDRKIDITAGGANTKGRFVIRPPKIDPTPHVTAVIKNNEPV